MIRSASGEAVAELCGALPHATNNVAEYQGLISALEWCAGQGATPVTIRSDSLLLIQQMRGAYRVKSEGLKPLHGRARQRVLQIGQVDFEHVPREDNGDADRLANLAMDEAGEGAN
jgi:probable phosphoglycerate mutase